MTGDIPWPFAVRVAGRVAGHHPLEKSYHLSALRSQAPDLLNRAGRLVEEETGLSTSGAVTVEVVDRVAWVDRNVAFFSRLLGPAEERIAEKLSESGVLGQASAAAARRLVAAETGALLGVMARRVLGQYELVLPSNSEGDVVYLVGPNVLALERAHQFRPSEFRFWLSIHESAHRAQFQGVPWLSDYFLSLVEELVAGSEPEPGRFKRIATELRAAAQSGDDLIGQTGLLGMLATEKQRETIDRVQALMSILEGHGHVIMDRIGARHLHTQKRMSNILKQRRTDPRMAAFLRLSGMEMKLRQYEIGERFVLEVERLAGWSGVDLVWGGPEQLPNLRELEDPAQWLSRVA